MCVVRDENPDLMLCQGINIISSVSLNECYNCFTAYSSVRNISCLLLFKKSDKISEAKFRRNLANVNYPRVTFKICYFSPLFNS